jgi:hypothetical protein
MKMSCFSTPLRLCKYEGPQDGKQMRSEVFPDDATRQCTSHARLWIVNALGGSDTVKGTTAEGTAQLAIVSLSHPMSNVFVRTTQNELALFISCSGPPR